MNAYESTLAELAAAARELNDFAKQLRDNPSDVEEDRQVIMKAAVDLKRRMEEFMS